MKKKIISLVNHKGGVGKTTTTLNLGKALSLLGEKVLLIDIDPQANLSQSLGINQDLSMYEVLCNDIDLPITSIAENLFVVPANLMLSTAETKLSSDHVTGYFKLREALSKHKDNYDFVLIDCPPNLAILTINALLAANEIIITLEPQFLSVTGLQTILDLHQKLVTLNNDLKILGLLFTRYNRNVVSKSIIEQCHTAYQGLIFETVIRQNAKIMEASAVQKDIFSYDNKSTGAIDYMALAQEILKNN